MLYTSILYTDIERSALAKTPFQTHLLAFIKSVNSLIVNLYNRTAVAKRIENQRALSRRCKQLSGCLRYMSTQIYTWHIMFRNFPQKATSATRYGARAFSMSYWRSQSRKEFINSYNHLNMTGRQGSSERRSRPWLRERGARRGSGGRDSPNGAYRSEGPCRHNMSYIFVISKV